MRTLLYLTAFLTIIASSCTLSAKQEAHLNKQLSRFVESNNEGIMLEAVALSHPAVVRYYKNQNDSVFMEHFKHGLSKNEEAGDFIEDPIFRESKEDQNLIQRKYELKFYNSDIMLNPKYIIFAVSEDKGENWFFIRSEDYYNDEIKGFKRLFKK